MAKQRTRTDVYQNRYLLTFHGTAHIRLKACFNLFKSTHYYPDMLQKDVTNWWQLVYRAKSTKFKDTILYPTQLLLKPIKRFLGIHMDIIALFNSACNGRHGVITIIDTHHWLVRNYLNCNEES